MQALSFSLIRTMVRSGKYVIDLNPLLFEHPLLLPKGIEKIDYELKNEAFHGKFANLLQTSSSREILTELESLSSMTVRLIIPPTKPFINVEKATLWRKFVDGFKNWLRYNETITLWPLQSVTLPISILVGEGTEIPRCVIAIDPELEAKHLMVSFVTPALKHETTGQLGAHTYVTLFNHSPGKRVVIKDMMRIGELRILK